ncbi:MAG: bifunctional demethylmenaquinone methyltransferase/2-methoxy-6-polyprenyl-1,4-benzoquinol methylase UbiE [Planctomycetaceae bacterium]|nr:bifunctional demethylmenaquinone methyltransferase/2-methoxy-6-polyprenyl-1,4-benzoquinol methylase UbiE [Planctomycetaceae bacterium]MBL4886658.1 bifunctional demethylmenaquinone methyltransferase/2-methoxy-6-polyprenyl-1,4-benzoquinol methylase UbiE [Planctomycetaceae bacterium]
MSSPEIHHSADSNASSGSDSQAETSSNEGASASESSIDKSGQRVQKMFGEIAPRYDLMNHVLSGGTDYYWRWYTIRKASPQGTAPILDVCTGTGDLAFAYWLRGQKKIAVTGSDFTPEMLELAREKFNKEYSTKNNDAANVEFIQADTQQLPFEDDHFQIVSVAFGLRNIADTMQGLKEMKRVCLPGGRIVILEFSLPGNRLLRGIYSWYFRNILPRIGQFFAQNKQGAYEYLPETVSAFPYGQELASLLERAGLEKVKFIPLTFGIATLYIGSKPETNKQQES